MAKGRDSISVLCLVMLNSRLSFLLRCTTALGGVVEASTIKCVSRVWPRPLRKFLYSLVTGVQPCQEKTLVSVICPIMFFAVSSVCHWLGATCFKERVALMVNGMLPPLKPYS